MINRVTLTGHFTLLDDTPARGTVLIRPSRSPILDLDGKQVISGPQRFQLDVDGRFSVDLPPTDDPALGAQFTYDVMVTLHHTNWQVAGLTLPADMVSVDVLDPPAGEVKEYPTRAEWDALTGAAVAEMETALAGAETAREVSVEARDVTVVARDETLTARDVTLTARDTAVGAAGEAETARDEAVSAVGDALAGKVTGTGLTLRYDNSVGERVFLDHPGGSTMIYGDTGWRDMSSYLPPGVDGAFLVRRTLHAIDILIDVMITTRSALIGISKEEVTSFIYDLPPNLFPRNGSVPAPLTVRDGYSSESMGTVVADRQSSTATRLRVSSNSGGSWSFGDLIKITGAVPNDRPWPDAQFGQPV